VRRPTSVGFREPKILDLASIAWVWFAALLVGTVSGFIHTDRGSGAETWTQWIIPIGAIVLAVRFTEWWPDEYQRRHVQTAPEG
jgi:hypothetical protein